MKKAGAVSMLVFMWLMLMSPFAYAVGDALTLEEIIAEENRIQQENGQEVQPKQTGTEYAEGNYTPIGVQTGQEENVQQTAKEMMGRLGEAAVADTNHPRAVAAAGTLKTLVGAVITVLCYALTVFISLSVVVDLIYITIPFTRKFLGNGYAGNAQAGNVNAANQVGNIGMGYGGGMGGGLGGGGFGGGYGGYGNRFGGFGNVFGGRMGGARDSMGAYQDQVGTMTGRMQLVTNAALNAAASETTIDPDGRNAHPLKIYTKSMIGVMVGTPLLIILAVSGVLFNLGLAIGGLVTQLISGIGGMI